MKSLSFRGWSFLDVIMGNRARKLVIVCLNFRKQPSRYSIKNCCNINRKTLLLDSLFNKVAGLTACNFFNKGLLHSCFPVNIAKSIRWPILKKIYKRLLLNFAVKLRDVLPLLCYSKNYSF